MGSSYTATIQFIPLTPTAVGGQRIHEADVFKLKYSSHHSGWNLIARFGLELERWVWSSQNKAKLSPQTKAPLIPQESAYSACQTWIALPFTDAFKDQLLFGPKKFPSKEMIEDVRRAGIVIVTVAIGIFFFNVCALWQSVCVRVVSACTLVLVTLYMPYCFAFMLVMHYVFISCLLHTWWAVQVWTAC